MSSPFRARAVGMRLFPGEGRGPAVRPVPLGPGLRRGTTLLALLLALPACDREQRDMAGQPKAETKSFVTSGDPRSAEYENNAFHIAQGQKWYGWFNCSGCHFHGGGGMGPPLMDEQWIYGGRMEDIVASILYGRPNGMPDWHDKITEQQAWELAAYVKSLSAQPRQDALSARADEMSNSEPQTLQGRKKVVPENMAPPGSEDR